MSDNFTIIRLILALLVLLSHSFALLGVTEPNFLGRTLGNFAVHGFFALSGFLIAGSYLNSSGLRSFFIKRVLRITPALIVGYGFSIVVGKWCESFSTNPVPYIVNGSLWTLSWEALMYGGVAAAGLLGMLNPSVVASLYVTSFLLYFANLSDQSSAIEIVAPLALLFLGGAFIKLHLRELNLKFYGISGCLILLALFTPIISEALQRVLQTIPWVWGPKTNFGELRGFAYLIVFPFATIFLCQYFFVSLPLKNDYSYGVYIFAWPVQQATIYLATKGGYSLTPWALFAASGVCTLLAAVVSWHLLEKPALNLRTALRC